MILGKDAEESCIAKVPFQGETVSQVWEAVCCALSLSASFQSKERSSRVRQALKEAAEVAQASIELNKAMSWSYSHSWLTFACLCKIFAVYNGSHFIISHLHLSWAGQEGEKEASLYLWFVVVAVVAVVVVANQKHPKTIKNSYFRNLISEHDPRTDCTLRNAPSRSRSRKRRRKRSSFAAQIFACLLREFHPDSWAFFTLIGSWASLSCVKKKVKFEQRQEEEKEVDFGAT